MMHVRPTVGVVLALTLVTAVSCGAGTSAPTADPLAGRYFASGGTSALPPFEALTKRFSELHPGVKWEIADVGSDASVKLTASGEVDVGFISRDLKAAEKGKVELVVMAVVGTAVVVSAKNPVNGLSKEQVRQVFSGQVNDWSQVGGKPGPIRVIAREQGSSTRATFESCFMEGKGSYVSDATVLDDYREVLRLLYTRDDMVSMITIEKDTLTDPQIRLLAIDGAAATRENLHSGTYKCRRPLYLIHHPDLGKLKPAIRAFLDFVSGPEGQKVLASF